MRGEGFWGTLHSKNFWGVYRDIRTEPRNPPHQPVLNPDPCMNPKHSKTQKKSLKPRLGPSCRHLQSRRIGPVVAEQPAPWHFLGLFEGLGLRVEVQGVRAAKKRQVL